jgi:hypothetical protein
MKYLLQMNSMLPNRVLFFAGKADDPFGDEFSQSFGDDAPSGGGADSMPDSTTGNEQGMPFLKPHDLKQPQGKLELIRVGMPTDYSDVVLVVQLGAKQFRLGLKTFDKGYEACKAKFGNKKSDWHGTLLYKVMPWKGNREGFVAIRPAK